MDALFQIQEPFRFFALRLLDRNLAFPLGDGNDRLFVHHVSMFRMNFDERFLH